MWPSLGWGFGIGADAGRCDEARALVFGLQVDSWAVGILAYELLVGWPPFEQVRMPGIEPVTSAAGRACSQHTARLGGPVFTAACCFYAAHETFGLSWHRFLCPQESRAATYEHIMYKDPKYPSWMSEDARKFINYALCKVRRWVAPNRWSVGRRRSVGRAGGRPHPRNLSRPGSTQQSRGVRASPHALQRPCFPPLPYSRRASPVRSAPRPGSPRTRAERQPAAQHRGSADAGLGHALHQPLAVHGGRGALVHRAQPAAPLRERHERVAAHLQQRAHLAGERTRPSWWGEGALGAPRRVADQWAERNRLHNDKSDSAAGDGMS
jgi:hypothetical protein